MDINNQMIQFNISIRPAMRKKTMVKTTFQLGQLN